MAVDKLVDSAQLETDLTSIATAIRTKGGTNESLSFPTDFVNAINNIQTGGNNSGDLVEKDVNFIDYDGTLLYSYTATEANALTALPANPSHAGLVAQGWNWTLAEIKSRLASSTGAFFVGQMYTTASGNTEIDIEIDELTVNTELPLKFSYYNPNSNGIKVYWGDGTYSTVPTVGNLTSTRRQEHTYTSVGTYTISIELSNDAELRLASWGTSSSYQFSGLFWATSNDWYGNVNKAPKYSKIVKAVRVGNNCDLHYRAFLNCMSLEYVTLPSTIIRKHTNIYQSTFENCYNLKSLTIPRGVVTIGSGAFSYCYNLLNISIPNTITGNITTFCDDCYSLKNIFIKTNETTICNRFALTLQNLKYVSIPNTITSIGGSSFEKSGITDIVIPNSVTTISTYTFNGCHMLRNVTMSNSLTSVGEAAFSACYVLDSIELPNTLTYLSRYIFSYCYSLRTIKLPNSLTRIGEAAFLRCRSLYYLQLPNTITTIEKQAFAECYSLLEIDIPNSMTILEDDLFYLCYSLRRIGLPNGLTSIGDRCFYMCYNLEKLTIPSTVTYIGGLAFYYLIWCTEYHFLSTTPPALYSSNVFENMKSDAVIYVPQGCLEAYQTANNWSSYASYMQEEPST